MCRAVTAVRDRTSSCRASQRPCLAKPRIAGLPHTLSHPCLPMTHAYYFPTALPAGATRHAVPPLTAGRPRAHSTLMKPDCDAPCPSRAFDKTPQTTRHAFEVCQGTRRRPRPGQGVPAHDCGLPVLATVPTLARRSAGAQRRPTATKAASLFARARRRGRTACSPSSPQAPPSPGPPPLSRPAGGSS